MNWQTILYILGGDLVILGILVLWLYHRYLNFKRQFITQFRLARGRFPSGDQIDHAWDIYETCNRDIELVVKYTPEY